jgi:hypothetical protein
LPRLCGMGFLLEFLFRQRDIPFLTFKVLELGMKVANRVEIREK